MPRPPETLLHTVYLVDRYGDTLVVRPRGDAAGFSLQAVHVEMATILTLAQQPAVKHLLIDLSGGNYFGSVILGSLVQLGQTVRNRGGRIGLCGASTDMQDVLRLMRLDQMWEMFPALNSGLWALATQPLGERLWRQRQTMAGLAVIALALLIYLYYPRPNHAQINYRHLSSLWQEVESRREQAGDEEWARLQKRVERELQPVLAGMNRRGKAGLVSDAERYLMYIVRDEWPPAMDRHHANSDAHRQLIQRHFRFSEALLEGRRLPTTVPSKRPPHSPE